MRGVYTFLKFEVYIALCFTKHFLKYFYGIFFHQCVCCNSFLSFNTHFLNTVVVFCSIVLTSRSHKLEKKRIFSFYLRQFLLKANLISIPPYFFFFLFIFCSAMKGHFSFPYPSIIMALRFLHRPILLAIKKIICLKNKGSRALCHPLINKVLHKALTCVILW